MLALRRGIEQSSCVGHRFFFRNCHAVSSARLCEDTPQNAQLESLHIRNHTYQRDSWTNVTSKLISLTDRKLHLEPYNPLCLLKQRIVDYFHKNFRKRFSNSPRYFVTESLSPVVTLFQNFDSLLIPADHPSRKVSDTYYVNQQHVLRSHTSAHQHDLISSGLDAFLAFGDCYRRDQIDRTHYPAFHQMEGVRLFSADELFRSSTVNTVHLFESCPSERSTEKQELHTLDTARVIERQLKMCLEGLAKALLGKDVQYRWVDTYFPFTHPSWELEILYEDEWMEMLGCGVIEQRILAAAGASEKVGFAFGLGLERLAMKLYKIPDIRLFWSKDSGFLNQFHTDNFRKNIEYIPISKYPQCANDLAFWLPQDREFVRTDFYDLVRSVAGDIVEQVHLIDEFQHPKSGKRSECYRIVYRHHERTLTQAEANAVHAKISLLAASNLGVEVRNS